MDTLLDYLNAGYAKAGTWAALATKLKVNLRTVTHWRMGKGWPQPATVLRLARYLGTDQRLALLHHQTWTTKGKVKKAWEALVAGYLEAADPGEEGA
jgi:hypothetical protein